MTGCQVEDGLNLSIAPSAFFRKRILPSWLELEDGGGGVGVGWGVGEAVAVGFVCWIGAEGGVGSTVGATVGVGVDVATGAGADPPAVPAPANGVSHFTVSVGDRPKLSLDA